MKISPSKVRQMKLIVLYCSRCTVVTRFFNLFRFCPYIKAEYPWNEVAKQIFFLSEQAKFFCFRKIGRNLEQTWKKLSKMVRKRGKTFIQLNWPQWKRAIRKGHTSFLVIRFWYLKLMSIDSALSSASGKLT